MLRITNVEMLPLETKQSGDKLLPHSDLRGAGVFLDEVSRSLKGQVTGSYEYGEEILSSINAENFLTSYKGYC
jgi:hypothetical protein